MGSSLPFFTVLVRLVSERFAVSRALSPGDGLSCPLIEGAFSAAVPIRVGSMIHSVQKTPDFMPTNAPMVGKEL